MTTNGCPDFMRKTTILVEEKWECRDLDTWEPSVRPQPCQPGGLWSVRSGQVKRWRAWWSRGPVRLGSRGRVLLGPDHAGQTLPSDIGSLGLWQRHGGLTEISWFPGNVCGPAQHVVLSVPTQLSLIDSLVPFLRGPFVNMVCRF